MQKGAPGIFEFFDHIAPLLPDCSGPAPLDPDNPDLDITKNLPCMKKVLKKVSETELGTHLCYPGAAEIDAMSETDTRKQLGFLRNFDGLASFTLKLSATMEGELTTCMSEILDVQASIIKGTHLWGATYFLQVRDKLHKEPQGTGIHLKEKLISEIKRRAEDPHFTLWDLCPFLDAVTTKVTSIV